MKRILRVAIFLFCLSCLAGAQGIQTPIINLPLAGAWQPCLDVQNEWRQPNQYVFCDTASGALVQIRAQYELRSVQQISQFFATAGQQSAGDIEASKLLVSSVFPIPSKYITAISPVLHNGGKPPHLWEVKEPGNRGWFYLAQLFGGFRVTGGSTSSQAMEEYYPIRVTRAEHKSVTLGEALLFEAETEKPPLEAVAKKYKFPAESVAQRVRYGWIQYAPGGVGSGNGVVSVVFAAPVNSGLDVTSVLQQVIANIGKTTTTALQ